MATTLEELQAMAKEERYQMSESDEEEGEEYSFSVPYSLLESCIVTGLSTNTKIEQLNHLFSPFGDIVETDIDLYNDKETGDLKAVGFVSFANDKSFHDAVEALNGYNLEGHTITVFVSKIRKYVENYGRYPQTKTKTKD